MVHNDNHSFLFERQIFNASFFEAMKEMLETMLSAHPDVLAHNTPESEAIFTFMEKLLFDVIAMSSDNKQIGDITRLYVNMLKLNPSQTVRLIDKRILMKNAAEKD